MNFFVLSGSASDKINYNSLNTSTTPQSQLNVELNTLGCSPCAQDPPRSQELLFDESDSPAQLITRSLLPSTIDTIYNCSAMIDEPRYTTMSSMDISTIICIDRTMSRTMSQLNVEDFRTSQQSVYSSSRQCPQRSLSLGNILSEDSTADTVLLENDSQNSMNEPQVLDFIEETVIQLPVHESSIDYAMTNRRNSRKKSNSITHCQQHDLSLINKLSHTPLNHSTTSLPANTQLLIDNTWNDPITLPIEQTSSLLINSLTSVNTHLQSPRRLLLSKYHIISNPRTFSTLTNVNNNSAQSNSIDTLKKIQNPKDSNLFQVQDTSTIPTTRDINNLIQHNSFIDTQQLTSSQLANNKVTEMTSHSPIQEREMIYVEEQTNVVDETLCTPPKANNVTLTPVPPFKRSRGGITRNESITRTSNYISALENMNDEYSSPSPTTLPHFSEICTQYQSTQVDFASPVEQSSTKLCVYCESSFIISWRDLSREIRSLCNSCAQHYQLSSLFPTQQNKRKRKITTSNSLPKRAPPRKAKPQTPAKQTKTPIRKQKNLDSGQKESKQDIYNLGSLVWAKWSVNGFYYPATIVALLSPVKCRVKFFDDEEEESLLINVRLYRLTPGDHVLARQASNNLFETVVQELLPNGSTHDVIFRKEKASKNVIFKHTPLSSIQMNVRSNNNHALQIPQIVHPSAPGENESSCYVHDRLANDQSPATPPHNVTTITKANKATRSSSTQPNTPRKDLPLTKQQKKEPSKSTEITPCSALPSSPTPRRTPTKSGTLNLRGLRKMRPLDLSTDTNNSPGPATRSITQKKQLFCGLEFIVTTIRLDVTPASVLTDSDVAACDQNSPKAPEVSRDDIVRWLTERGAIVQNDLKALISAVSIHKNKQEHKRFCLASAPMRTLKYLTALGLNIPRVSYRWIVECVQKEELIDYERFQLSNGYSLEINAYTTGLHCSQIFTVLVIHVVGDAAFKSDWSTALESSGAKVVTTKKMSEYVLCQHKPSKLSLDVKMVTKEWVIQCLINQYLFDSLSRKAYHW